MYYEAKDPVVLAGEKREAPKVVTVPVTAATPQFKDFHISNIVCDGAATAVFIRGLPEMNILGVYMDNMVIKAKAGVVCTEATGVYINNLKLITQETNPVISIDNSSSINLDNITYNPGSQLLFKVSGAKTDDIAISNTDTKAAKNKVEFKDGATAKSITIK